MKKTYCSSLAMSLFLTLLMFQMVGCKKVNPEGREDVRGRVTMNGQPIDPTYTAAISFVPVDDKPVTDGGGGQIVSSKYLLTNTEGVKPGKYKVKIFVNQYYDTKTGEPATKESGDFDMVHVSMIPPDYNDKSAIEFEVVSGKKNIFDHNIVTDYAPGKDTIPKQAKIKPVVQ